VRVVSLVPSSTETLISLGANVVGCTRFCEQPSIEQVGGTKNPDIAAILDLSPDLVVLDREENRLEDHDALVAAGVPVFVSDVTDVDAALGVVRQLAEAVGVEAPEMNTLGRAERADRPTAFVPIWRRPWMTISAGTYGASVLRYIGVGLAPLSSTDPYPTIEPGAISALAPDLVVVPSEPYEFSDAHLDELRSLVPFAQIVRVDGQDLFWWGKRTPAAISRLAAALALPPTAGPTNPR
jgi:ABC-type hemin transport system substrate-binding protein